MIDYYDRAGNPLTLEEWGNMFTPARDAETGGADEYRTVGRDVLDGDITVSTVWLGLNHNWDPNGPPLIFETMVFGGVNDEWQDRYSTEAQAVEGHARVVAACKAGERLE